MLNVSKADKAPQGFGGEGGGEGGVGGDGRGFDVGGGGGGGGLKRTDIKLLAQERVVPASVVVVHDESSQQNLHWSSFLRKRQGRGEENEGADSSSSAQCLCSPVHDGTSLQIKAGVRRTPSKSAEIKNGISKRIFDEWQVRTMIKIVYM